MEQVRSFIAIELPDELKLGLAQLEAQLKMSKPSWVKWVDPYKIHLTLKFLGSIAVDMISEITGAMEEAIQGISPFHLEVKDLGVFPNLRRVQVAWVGISGEVDKLSQLQQHLESNLARLGFAPETRPFTPHLTLASTSPHTEVAPAVFSVAAQASRVAPEVETSSMSNTCLPCSLQSRQVKALATLLRRSSTVEVLAWGGACRCRIRQSSTTGKLVSLPSSLASRLD